MDLLTLLYFFYREYSRTEAVAAAHSYYYLQFDYNGNIGGGPLDVCRGQYKYTEGGTSTSPGGNPLIELVYTEYSGDDCTGTATSYVLAFPAAGVNEYPFYGTYIVLTNSIPNPANFILIR